MKRPWRLLLDGPAPGARNMAIDEALLVHVTHEGATLRLYSWSEPTLSIGLRQQGAQWARRCAAAGVAIVRRPTGGGAVLHGGDLTYALAAPAGCPDLPADLPGSYGWIQRALLDGLRRAGLPVGPAAPTPLAAREAACFAGSLGAEIEIGGRKLVGSAQRRLPTGLLQHGSIRLREPRGLSHLLFGPAVPPTPPMPADEGLPQKLSLHLVDAFRDALGGRLREGRLGAAERYTAVRHEQQRRNQPLWSGGTVLKMAPVHRR